MTAALWITTALIALLASVLMKLSVRVVARSADNGWDNAIAYVVTTALVLYFPVRWMMTSGSWAWIALAPALVWIVQTVTLRVFYELSLGRAWVLGLVHTLTTAAVTSALSLVVAVIAAYIMYGRIISDPMILIRIILRLIGIGDVGDDALAF
jgi:hypothetical protein